MPKAKQTITKATRRAPKKRPPRRKTSAERDELKLRRHPESDELRLLPVAALQQDSVMLDEQANHIVLTIRVPKAVIRNNMQLLMGLADRSLD
jgi:hypothetical protein